MTLAQFSGGLERVARGLPREFDRAIFQAAQQLNSDIKTRVFTTGGHKDINGQPIGNYKPGPYKNLRRSEGLQTATVDLVREGDLLASVKTVKGRAQSAVVFNSAKQTEIGRANEVRFKGKEETIINDSEKEKQRALNLIDELMQEYFDSILK